MGLPFLERNESRHALHVPAYMSAGRMAAPDCHGPKAWDSVPALAIDKPSAAFLMQRGRKTARLLSASTPTPPWISIPDASRWPGIMSLVPRVGFSFDGTSTLE